jgi:hypothetical protein
VSPEQFISLVARLSYKPGWAVAAVDDPKIGAMSLRVAFTVPDATLVSPRPLPLRIKYLIPYFRLRLLDERAALVIVADRIMEMERHEFREWFKLDGVPINPAHGPDGGLL